MDKAKSGFVDFIPAEQEAGTPYGIGGYRDFVPAPEPKEVVIAEETPKTPKKRGSK